MNWAFGYINCRGFKSWALIIDLDSIDKIVLPWTRIMGHKYSWALNRIACVYLKVNRYNLNKIRCKNKVP